MPAILRKEYVSGGYYLARLAKRAKYMSPELVPDQVVSASSMICDYFPNTWAIKWASNDAEDRSKKSAVFGILRTTFLMSWSGQPDRCLKSSAGRAPFTGWTRPGRRETSSF